MIVPLVRRPGAIFQVFLARFRGLEQSSCRSHPPKFTTLTPPLEGRLRALGFERFRTFGALHMGAGG